MKDRLLSSSSESMVSSSFSSKNHDKFSPFKKAGYGREKEKSKTKRPKPPGWLQEY